MDLQLDMEFSIGKNKVPTMEIQCGREGKPKTKHVDLKGEKEAVACGMWRSRMVAEKV
jgi:hypothetical protein